MRKRCIVKLVLSIYLVASSTNYFAQYKWETGDISVKSTTYSVKVDSENWITFKRKDYDPKRDLVFGYNQEKGKVEVVIVSAQEFVNVIKNAFSQEKLERMSKLEKQFSLSITLDEEGKPIDVSFHLNPQTQVTPEELVYIENGIINRVCYQIRRENPFGQPCVYSAGGFIKYQDILNGEIPALKISEQRGKEKAEWER